MITISIIIIISSSIIIVRPGWRSHARNQHLRNHRGSSVAFSNGLPMVFSNRTSLFSGIFQRTVTCPVDFYWNRQMNVQWHFPMDCHFCEIWRVIFCPDFRRLGHRLPDSEFEALLLVFLLLLLLPKYPIINSSSIYNRILFVFYFYYYDYACNIQRCRSAQTPNKLEARISCRQMGSTLMGSLQN